MSPWVPIAWRNVGRNPRRSALTMGAIGFAVWLIAFAFGIQGGAYDAMVDSAARMLTGHMQIQAEDYLDNPRLRSTVGNVQATLKGVRAVDGVVAAYPEASVFALVAVGERSYGAQVMGVDPSSVLEHSTLPKSVKQGRYLDRDHAYEAVIGTVLARNVGAKLGDDLAILGTGKDGGVAALSVVVVGIVDSGNVDLDRSLVQIPFRVFQDEFEFHDEANVIVVQVKNVGVVAETLPKIAALVPAAKVRSWQELLPGIESIIASKRAGGRFVFTLLALMVTLSIVNTFVMSVFERTREFGMLMAVGVRPNSLQGLLQFEALLLCGGGVLVGAAAALGSLLLLNHVGIPFPASMAQTMRNFNLPDRIFPSVAAANIVIPAGLMLLGTQVAAFFPTLRVRQLDPVVAMRDQ